MNWSQENCLIDGHRLTCERREGDLRLVPDDPHLCGVVSFKESDTIYRKSDTSQSLMRAIFGLGLKGIAFC